jgi:cytochrome c oxidase subunit 4
MTAHTADAEHFAGSNRLFISIWFWLLAITALEVFLGYIHLPLFYMLTILMGLSIIKAALIIAYFMHLRFERLTLVLTLIPALVICICLFAVFFPDSFRSLGLRNPQKAPAAVEAH